MTSDPKKQQSRYATNRGRSLSRQILGNDMDLVNKYASKYTPQSQSHGALKRTNTYSAVPNTMGYGGYASYGGGGYGHNQFSHGYNSGSSSSFSSMASSGGNKSNRKKPRRQPSNLIQSANTTQWDNTAVTSQEADMSAAMSAMVGNYQNRLIEQANFLDEIQDEAEDDDNFAKAENADDWSVKEVCYWLTTIHLDKYIKAFADQIIDGSILLRDLDENMLTNELGIKRLHVRKIIREITKLKKASPKLKKEKNDSRDQLIEQLRKEIDELKEKNKSLTQENNKLKSNRNSSHYSARDSNKYKY